MNQFKGKCQSCGMPVSRAEYWGSEASGTRSEKYCFHCYKNGKFTDPHINVDQMVQKIRGKMVEMYIPSFVASYMANGVRKLDRWNKSGRRDAKAPFTSEQYPD